MTIKRALLATALLLQAIPPAGAEVFTFSIIRMFPGFTCEFTEKVQNISLGNLELPAKGGDTILNPTPFAVGLKCGARVGSIAVRVTGTGTGPDGTGFENTGSTKDFLGLKVTGGLEASNTVEMDSGNEFVLTPAGGEAKLNFVAGMSAAAGRPQTSGDFASVLHFTVLYE